MDIKLSVKKVMQNVLSIDEIAINENSSTETITSWDSLRHIQLVVSLEEEFEIEFTDGEIPELTSFSSIIKTINSRKT